MWLPTPDNRVKINFVGLFNGLTKTLVIGDIIRSSESTLIAAYVGKTTAEHSWEVELHALLQRVNLSRIRTAICNSLRQLLNSDRIFSKAWEPVLGINGNMVTSSSYPSDIVGNQILS